VVLVGPLGIRYPWQRLERPVHATLEENRGRFAGRFAVVAQAGGRRSTTVARDLRNEDARFLAAHLR
jgi:hypothetical protein